MNVTEHKNLPKIVVRQIIKLINQRTITRTGQGEASWARANKRFEQAIALTNTQLLLADVLDEEQMNDIEDIYNDTVGIFKDRKVTQQPYRQPAILQKPKPTTRPLPRMTVRGKYPSRDTARLQRFFKIKETGSWNREVENHVISFQRVNRLMPDGIVGERTIKYLLGAGV